LILDLSITAAAANLRCILVKDHFMLPYVRITTLPGQFVHHLQVFCGVCKQPTNENYPFVFPPNIFCDVSGNGQNKTGSSSYEQFFQSTASLHLISGQVFSNHAIVTSSRTARPGTHRELDR